MKEKSRKRRGRDADMVGVKNTFYLLLLFASAILQYPMWTQTCV